VAGGVTQRTPFIDGKQVILNMKRILLVDDNPINRELLREILDTEGYEVEEAEDGLNALRLYKERTPDLTILDLQMPVLDGFETLKRILECNAGAVVMAVTAFAMRGDRERALAAGFLDYITKPVEMNHLRIRVRELLA
jgi:CheY-like chemotaxis protein